MSKANFAFLDNHLFSWLIFVLVMMQGMATQNKELARQLLLSRPQLPKALFQVCTFLLYQFLCEFIQAQHSLMTNLSLSNTTCVCMIDVCYGSYQGLLSSGIICYALVVVGYVLWMHAISILTWFAYLVAFLSLSFPLFKVEKLSQPFYFV